MAATFTSPLRWPDGWPVTSDRARKWGNFGRSLTIAKATDSLGEELARLGAENVVISASLQVGQRGTPLSSQRQPDNPGAAVYFTLKGREMVMAQDVFDKVEKNIRSLALAIEHMRGLERHGGAHMMERAFAGFTALPPPKDGSAPQDRPVIWREELGIDTAWSVLAAPDLLVLVESRYRDLAKQYHADAGGDGTRMIRLNAAIAMARDELKGK